MIIQGIFDLLYYIAIIAAGFLSITYVYFKYCYTYWKKNNVPVLEPTFPYGNCENVIKAKNSISEYLVNVYNIMKSRGHKYAGLYFFQNPSFMPISVDLIKIIISRDFSYFIDRGMYYDEKNDPLSAHLFSLNGQKWKNLRAKLTPTFTSGKLKKMFQTLVDCSLELRDCLNEPIRTGEPVDIKQILIQYTMDVIGSCAFGIECNSFKNPNTEFIRIGKKGFSAEGFDHIKMFFAFAFPNVAKFFNMRITNQEVDTFYRNLVKETVEYREKNNISRNDFMQLLIQLKNNTLKVDDNDDDDNDAHAHEERQKSEIGTTLTINEVAAQAYLFFIAGFDTSSTALTFCLFELSQNQDIQEKLRAEIVRVLKKYEGKITYDALVEMHYMNRVIQESLRKYPPITMLQRETTSDYTIPDTNITLKKGTVVIIPTYAIHLDPEYYPEPDRFDPDRFTEKNKSSRPEFTWLPFGEGPRICIGLRFGMMQIKVGLCQLLLNYKFTLNPKTKMPIRMDSKAIVFSAQDIIYLTPEKVLS